MPGLIPNAFNSYSHPNPGQSGLQTFGSTVLRQIPYYNIGGSIFHLLNGTLGQHGPSPSIIGRLGQALFPGIGQQTPPSTGTAFGGSNGNPQGAIDPTDPNNPLNTGADPNTPFYPGQQNTGSAGGFLPPPVNSAGTPNQLAANQESNFITGFQNLQSTASSPYYQNDMRGPETGGLTPAPRFGSSFSQPSSHLAAYQNAYPMGSTLAQIVAFNQAVQGGSIPTYQQFAGLPAYHPPAAAPPPTGHA